MHLGVILVIGGVFWEHLAGPGWAGWAGILIGHIFILAGMNRNRMRTPLDWPLLLLVLMAGISMWITSSVDVTSVQVSRLLASIAGCYAFLRLSDRPRVLFLGGVGLGLLGVLLALSSPFVVAWNEAKGVVPVPSAIYSLFPLLVSDSVHPNIMSNLMVLLFPLPLAYLLGSSTGFSARSAGRLKVTAALALGLMGVVLFLTKSRGAYIAGALGALTVLWMCRRRALALVLTILMFGLGIAVLQQTIDMPQAAGELGAITDAGTWSFRKEVWQIAIWMIDDFPFTGVGMGTFNDVGTRLYPSLQAGNPGTHNLFLQVGVDLGLPGLVAYGAIVLITLSCGLNAVRCGARDDVGVHQPLVIGTFAGISAFLSHGLLDNTVWGTRASFIPWLAIGLLTALCIRSPDLPGETPMKRVDGTSKAPTRGTDQEAKGPGGGCSFSKRMDSSYFRLDAINW